VENIPRPHTQKNANFRHMTQFLCLLLITAAASIRDVHILKLYFSAATVKWKRLLAFLEQLNNDCELVFYKQRLDNT
jgi:hypothetical protein